MNAQLKTQITKLRVMAQMVIAECDKTEALMDKPVSQRVVNKAKQKSATRSLILKRFNAHNKGLAKQS